MHRLPLPLGLAKVPHTRVLGGSAWTQIGPFRGVITCLNFHKQMFGKSHSILAFICGDSASASTFSITGRYWATSIILLDWQSSQILVWLSHLAVPSADAMFFAELFVAEFAKASYK